MSAPRRYRFALCAILAIALVAAFYVALTRAHKEHNARRVELALDYTDFAALARSYGYDQAQFLIALRRAGLTSLAVSEELGANVNAGSSAILLPGAQLIAQARLSPLAEPTLARAARTGGLRPDELYLLVYGAGDVARYRTALGLHLGARAVRVLRAAGPTILAIRSQSDFINSLGFGLPAEPLALARDLGLLLVPRVQNDERFGPAQIDAVFAGFARAGPKTSTAIFFGARNEVLGFPNHLDDTARAFERTGINFGTIEAYDRNQAQKGNDPLARQAIDRTARVEAISKAELDKLDFRTVVARYLLGVRERNVRVVYLRPLLHAEGDSSIEMTNVELVRQIAVGLRERGFKLGRATPIAAFGANPFVIALVSLAVPAIILLLFEAFGVRRSRAAYALFAADLVLIALGYALHHDLLVRKMIALAGAISFATMGFVAIPRAFTAPAPATFRACLGAGFRTLGVALAFALMGALVVVGLLSVPLTMEEIDRFSGVKLVIVVPPLLAFGLYMFTRRFGNEASAPRASALAPVRVYQMVLLAVLAAAAFMYVSRSGNQSDIAPSSFELALRSGLTTILGVRPRFKEFMIGFPVLMLLPALRLEHRKLFGWLLAVSVAIGTADVVDTFSHLHTSLDVSLIRILNGAVLGCIIGIVAIAVYRAFARRLPT